MIGYKRILVPIDGSELSHMALRQASVLAQKFNSTINLLIVENSDYDLIFDNPEELEGIDHEVLIEASKLLDKNIDYKMAVLKGNPKHAITNYSKKIQAELIVIGATGTSHLSEILIGTTADYIVNHAVCNVFVVK
ncbi:universal stress protein [Lactococcus garvieae]|uniref:universal stress protein n=1 Tax=Lactococcus garvieae TaxID=1363 RepID=UPI001F60A487|nr:universal stress protein [Lactococcus garvieae]MCI3861389.1 universal stress protein [Lactococcus garvieae]